MDDSINLILCMEECLDSSIRRFKKDIDEYREFVQNSA
jgi:hypothetical protein